MVPTLQQRSARHSANVTAGFVKIIKGEMVGSEMSLHCCLLSGQNAVQKHVARALV
jgi:hypothetical protein